MKRIFIITSFVILTTLVIAGCSKRDYYYNEDYWLSKEHGEVVYSDSFCPYYVVETFNGYTVVRSADGYAPYEGSIIYGDLSRLGTRDLYNRSDGSIVRGEVTDYWLTYGEAQYLVDHLCY